MPDLPLPALTPCLFLGIPSQRAVPPDTILFPTASPCMALYRQTHFYALLLRSAGGGVVRACWLVILLCVSPRAYSAVSNNYLDDDGRRGGAEHLVKTSGRAAIMLLHWRRAGSLRRLGLLT